jgi:2-keto-4-pentenoate hydratase
MTAAGAAVMGHPAASVAWLADRLATEGEDLRAGQLVFSVASRRRSPSSRAAVAPSSSTAWA